MNQKPKPPKERIPSTSLFKFGIFLWVITWFPCQIFIQDTFLLMLGCGASIIILMVHIGIAFTIRLYGLDSHIQNRYKEFVKEKEAERNKKIKEQHKRKSD